MLYSLQGKGPITGAIRDLDRRVTRLEPRTNGDTDLQVAHNGFTYRPKRNRSTPQPSTTTARWA
jgi:hypothetical protein